MNNEDGENDNTVKFLLKALTVTFGLWAAVVAWGVNRVTHEMSDISDRQMAFSEKFGEYVTATERRITRLEEISKREHKLKEVGDE